MRHISLWFALLLAGCGTLPQPFYGNPGPAAARLALPPAPVLMVPTPATNLLNDAAARTFARDLAAELADYDVPSVAGSIQKNNWHLQITATRDGNNIMPSYDVIGPNGRSYGKLVGHPVPAAEWAKGSLAILAKAATTDAPALSKLMTRINARVQQSNPQSLENRPPRIFIGTMTGAPGDGDATLPMDLAHVLAGPNLKLVSSKQSADFTVTGKVKAPPAKNGQMLVELNWLVRDQNNRVIGQVTQIHMLRQNDIEPYWGDVAAAAAKEAAGGIRQVVQNAILKKANPPAVKPK